MATGDPTPILTPGRPLRRKERLPGEEDIPILAATFPGVGGNGSSRRGTGILIPFGPGDTSVCSGKSAPPAALEQDVAAGKEGDEEIPEESVLTHRGPADFILQRGKPG